jgi:hypothetical protein
MTVIVLSFISAHSPCGQPSARSPRTVHAGSTAPVRPHGFLHREANHIPLFAAAISCNAAFPKTPRTPGRRSACRSNGQPLSTISDISDISYSLPDQFSSRATWAAAPRPWTNDQPATPPDPIQRTFANLNRRLQRYQRSRTPTRVLLAPVPETPFDRLWITGTEYYPFNSNYAWTYNTVN